MPKFRDRLTGEIYEGDTEGNKIKTPNQPSKVPQLISIPDRSDIPTPESGPIGDIAKYLPATLTAAGGIAGGGLIPIPAVGSAIGSGIGSLAGKGLQNLAPDYFGEYKPSGPMEVARDVATDVAADLVGTGLSKIAKYAIPSERKKLTQAIVKKIFPTNLDSSQLNALAADPGFNVSVGQTNKIAETLENTFAPQAKAKFVKEQEKKILNEVLPVAQRNQEKLIQQGQKAANKTVDTIKTESKAAYDNFEPAINYNTTTVHEITPASGPIIDSKTGIITRGSRSQKVNPIQIKGAIPLNKSLAFANEVGDQIDNVLGAADSNLNQIDAASGGYLRTLRTELNKIRNVKNYIDPKTGKTAAPLAEFEQLKTVRDSLNDFLSNSKDEVLKGKLKGPLDGLEKLIRADMEEGVKGWGNNAYGKFRAAQDKWKELAQTVDPTMSKELLKAGKDGRTTYLEVAREALSDPEKSRQFLNITKDKGTLKDLFTTDLVQNAIDPTNNRFDPTKALDYLKKKDLVAREALSSSARGNLERFVRRAQLVGPHTENANVGLKLRAGQAGVQIALGGAGLIAGSFATDNPTLNTGAKVGGAVLLGIAGMNKFAKNVLLDPKMARIATGLLDIDPQSKAAKIGTKAILTAIKGEQVNFMTPDGETKPAIITNDGRVKILNQPAQE